MQNDIRLHLATNEKTQSDIEARYAPILQERFNLNLAAFTRYIPTLATALQKNSLKTKSIFVDKNAQTNIVDVASGTSFYHFNVDQEIAKQTDNIALHSVLVDLNDIQPSDVQGDSKAPIKYLNSYADFAKSTEAVSQQVADTKLDALVILGLGKGAHVQSLIDNTSASHVVIYEPNWEFFVCSLYCTDWYKILEQAESRQCQMYLQIDQSAFTLHEDIGELMDAFNVRHVLFYKHYNESHFDTVMQELRANNLSILKHANYLQTRDESNQAFQEWIPAWTPSFDISQWQTVSRSSDTFVNNFAAFEKYFANIAAKFSDYEALVWEPILHRSTGVINLFNTKHNTLHTMEDVRLHSEAISEHFKRYPNQDGLIFGYESDKLKHYLHNTFIRRANTLLIHQKDEKGELPQNIKSLILFGLDCGYALESLLDSTQIDNLFLCEPNPDFFYASLFAINWASILKKIDDNEERIYLNVGEAGTALYTDLNSQFLAAGAHLLADSYFFQPYENKVLARVVKDLRDQLKITFSLCENLDHVLYGIEHTKYALHHKIPAMAAEPEKLISKKVRELPLFVVGNGPSLDNNIHLLKEYRDKLLIVSCGTALQALHSYGIRPDFHAEVEQCRATFDWASRINDPEYLKSITLVSVNGIHPDTCGIYKDTLFAFKLGESSASSALSIFGADKFASLERAYPTVTNLAVNFFLKLGFKHLYLLGVDLGFVDYNKHHSSQSGYFENGKQIYDYQDNLAKSLPVRGNFRELVYTKAEFNISRMMMEQVLSHYKADCYNLSDGVFIEGTQALVDEDVLIVNQDIDRDACYRDIKNAFIVVQSDVCSAYNSAFSASILKQQIDKLREICTQNITDKQDVEAIIGDCRELMRENLEMGKSLFVYLFYGSLNNLCATLNKALMSQDESQALRNASLILEYWERLTHDTKLMVNQSGFLFDTSSSFSEKREAPHIQSMSVEAVAFDEHLHDYLRVCVAGAQAESAPPESRNSTPSLKLKKSLSECSPNQVRIVFLSGKKDVEQFSQACRPELNQQSAKMMLVYTEASLFESIQTRLESMRKDGLPTNHMCTLYLPMWIRPSRLEQVAQGYEPLIDGEEAIAFMLARVRDIERFTHMVFRTRFDETGLIRANQNTEDEYVSDAVGYLSQHLRPLLSLKHAYSFKRYIGYVENTDPSPTMLDGLKNRGLYIPRALEAYELLGEWYKAQQAIEVRNHFKEHLHSV